jgi:hypothetical protein
MVTMQLSHVGKIKAFAHLKLHLYLNDFSTDEFSLDKLKMHNRKWLRR